eukprot:1194144-Prorocentrum_minimum.AAC.1
MPRFFWDVDYVCSGYYGRPLGLCSIPDSTEVLISKFHQEDRGNPPRARTPPLPHMFTPRGRIAQSTL